MDQPEIIKKFAEQDEKLNAIYVSVVKNTQVFPVDTYYHDYRARIASCGDGVCCSGIYQYIHDCLGRFVILPFDSLCHQSIVQSQQWSSMMQ